MIGGPGSKGPDSNNKDGGRNGTPLFYLPADITVDPTDNRMYISDGYGNRRVVIVDAATGKYIGHFGAYGNNPIDDKAAAAAGGWMNDLTKGNMKPAFFRTPVHCVKISKEGLIYVCDRGNNRVQVFNGRDPNLGKECRNPSGEAGKCGFVKEQFVAVKTNGLPGSAVSMNFSTDAKQSCLYVGDNSNMTIYVLKRDTLEELGRLGRSGREAGEFHWLHQVSLDSRGNIYTAEVDTGKRLQKFVRYGEEGCSGTGRTTVGGVLR
jgi:DNA-binding beta-propeller fold protein YncE